MEAPTGKDGRVQHIHFLTWVEVRTASGNNCNGRVFDCVFCRTNSNDCISCHRKTGWDGGSATDQYQWHSQRAAAARGCGRAKACVAAIVAVVEK